MEISPERSFVAPEVPGVEERVIASRPGERRDRNRGEVPQPWGELIAPVTSACGYRRLAPPLAPLLSAAFEVGVADGRRPGRRPRVN